MKLEDERFLALTPEASWDALLDPAVLQRALPGCQELTGNVSEGYEATVVQKVGPVKATFTGEVTIEDVVEGRSCRMTGSGKGGVAGFAKGSADVALTPVEGGTLLTYAVTAQVGGKLAQLGGRVIDGFAKKMADQFFTNFKQIAEDDGAEASAGTGR